MDVSNTIGACAKDAASLAPFQHGVQTFDEAVSLTTTDDRDDDQHNGSKADDDLDLGSIYFDQKMPAGRGQVDRKARLF